MWLADTLRSVGGQIGRLPWFPLRRVYRRFSNYTMLAPETYVRNLALVKGFRHVPGAVVECGVWKGGMSAGMAQVAGVSRAYYLFDSFEGCPKAREIDGPKARSWQSDTNSPGYYNNSSADIGFSREAMQKAGATNVTITKGWFEQTLPSFRAEGGIAILRLDADWYDSTMTCLKHLFPQVNRGGVVIIDDYYAFEGCARAVHDYLSDHRSGFRISQFDNDVCYIANRREE